MSSFLTIWTPEKIAEAKDPCAAYAEYLQQTMGIPWPSIKDMTILRRKVKEIFEHYPHADWHTMCRIAEYFRSRKERFGRVWMVPQEFRKVWADGKLPELDPGFQPPDPNLESRVESALEHEEDPVWRRRLLLTSGAERREAIEDWERLHELVS